MAHRMARRMAGRVAGLGTQGGFGTPQGSDADPKSGPELTAHAADGPEAARASSLVAVQKLVGHSDISMTMRYYRNLEQSHSAADQIRAALGLGSKTGEIEVVTPSIGPSERLAFSVAEKV